MPSGSSLIKCALVDGSVTNDDSDLKPIDFERLRYVMKSNILGNLPEDSETVSASSIVTHSVLGKIAIAVSALIGLIG